MSRKRSHIVWGLFFVSPWIVGFLLFSVYPIANAFLLSFTDYQLSSPATTEFVGLGNYQRLFAVRLYNIDEEKQFRREMLTNRDAEVVRLGPEGSQVALGAREKGFWISIVNTVYFIAIGLPLQLLCAFLVAALLSIDIKGIATYRLLVYLPTLVPPVVVGVVWKIVLNGRFGPLNYALRSLGIGAPNWLSDPLWTKPALILINLWSSGGIILILLAGINDVPRECYEAAEIDGAGWWTKTWCITLPLISPVLMFVAITGIIYGFQAFTLPYVFGGAAGGPNNSVLFYAMHLYNNAIRYNSMGLASAMGIVLFIITMACTLLIFRFSQGRIFYRS